MVTKQEIRLANLQAEERVMRDSFNELAKQYNKTSAIFSLQEKMADLQKAKNADLEYETTLLKSIDRSDDAAYKARLQKINDLKISNKELEISIAKYKKQSDLVKSTYDSFSKTFNLQAAWIKGLNDSDKVIRQTILNLGMSGNKAEQVRRVFERSAMHVTQLGGSLKDVQDVMQGYANETGRSRVMTEKMVGDIIEIGRGTGLGVENASKMASQFELMGLDATTVKDMTQEFVIKSEKYGINTTKAIKDVNDNFQRLIKYNFKDGVKGMMQMSAYATKMNIDMNQALNAVDTARTLNGAIDLASQLQVMGGEFAKTDPFEMLYLSRNDPAEMTKKINEMTKGIVSFRKNSDGVFQKFISPADRDRLAYVEKALGMGAGELTQQALRMVDISKMRENLKGSTLSKDNKEVIEGAAFLNAKTGDFQVKIGENVKNIKDLTEADAKLFVEQQKTLEERAKLSMTFEESLQATLASFKSLLLPMLRGFQSVLDGFLVLISPLLKGLNSIVQSDFGMGLMKVVGGFTAVAILLRGVISGGISLFNMGKSLMSLKGLSGAWNNAKQWVSGGKFGKILDQKSDPNITTAPGSNGGGAGGGGGGGPVLTAAEQRLAQRRATYAARRMAQQRAADAATSLIESQAAEQAGRGEMFAGKGKMLAGKGKMMAGAGIGAAGLGIGGGIAVAALGVGQLAQSIKDVDVAKLEQMNGALTRIGATMVIFAVGLGVIAAAGDLAQPALEGIGLVALGVGTGIGVAAAGIGYMAKNLGDLVTASKGSGEIFLDLGIGVEKIASAMGSISWNGLMKGTGLSGVLGLISASSSGIATIADGLERIKVALSGKSEDFTAISDAVAKISSTKVASGSIFDELVTLLKNPLKVEFADTNMKANITLDIDGERFTSKAIDIPILARRLKDGR